MTREQVKDLRAEDGRVEEGKAEDGRNDMNDQRKRPVFSDLPEALTKSAPNPAPDDRQKQRESRMRGGRLGPAQGTGPHRGGPQPSGPDRVAPVDRPTLPSNGGITRNGDAPYGYTRTGLKRQSVYFRPEADPRSRKPKTSRRPTLQQRLVQLEQQLRPAPGLKTTSGGEYYLRTNETGTNKSGSDTNARRPDIADIDLSLDDRPRAAAVSTEGVIAVNRFGLGALPGELLEASVDAKQWLKDQLQQSPTRYTNDFLTTSDALFINDVFNDTYGDSLTVDRHLAAIARMDRMRAKAHTSGIPRIDDVMELIDWPEGRLWFHEIRMRDYLGTISRTPFLERLTRFWTNHFAIEAADATTGLVGAFERDVCRRHLTGKFSNLLIASTLHPAMLVYLDNEASIGKDAPWGDGINTSNENLGRELMELHTLGVNGGYTQDDVAEMGDALSGHSVGMPWEIPYGVEPGRYRFKPYFHQPGSRTILNKTYAEDNDGPGQMIAILNDLARHPSTIDHVCRKMIEHFISDTPPPALLQAMKTAWADNDGLLLAVYHAMIDHPLSWDINRDKLKSPVDYIVSAARRLGPDLIFDTADAAAPYYLYILWQDMGHFPLSAFSPEGWSDENLYWAKPAAMMTRMQWAHQIAARVPSVDPLIFLQDSVGNLLSTTTITEVSNAADARQGMTLALMSPEFQRR